MFPAGSLRQGLGDFPVIIWLYESLTQDEGSRVGSFFSLITTSSSTARSGNGNHLRLRC